MTSGRQGPNTFHLLIYKKWKDRLKKASPDQFFLSGKISPRCFSKAPSPGEHPKNQAQAQETSSVPPPPQQYLPY
jgi:hypothetical protein